MRINEQEIFPFNPMSPSKHANKFFSDLFVCVVIGVDVVVKLLMFRVLLVTELTVEVSPQVLQSFGNGFLFFRIVLKTQGRHK